MSLDHNYSCYLNTLCRLINNYYSTTTHTTPSYTFNTPTIRVHPKQHSPTTTLTVSYHQQYRRFPRCHVYNLLLQQRNLSFISVYFLFCHIVSVFLFLLYIYILCTVYRTSAFHPGNCCDNPMTIIM